MEETPTAKLAAEYLRLGGARLAKIDDNKISTRQWGYTRRVMPKNSGTRISRPSTRRVARRSFCIFPRSIACDRKTTVRHVPVG